MPDEKNNTGDWNTGYLNTGNWNTGNLNTGDWNTGYLNTGYLNTGYLNTGYRNTGNRNTGYLNTEDGPVRIFDVDVPGISHDALVEACKALLEELRLIRMKDSGAVYDPTCRTRAEVAIAKAEGRVA